MDLSPEHDGCEDEKEETLEAEENEEDDGRRWREVTALWKDEERSDQSTAEDGTAMTCSDEQAGGATASTRHLLGAKSKSATHLSSPPRSSK